MKTSFSVKRTVFLELMLGMAVIYITALIVTRDDMLLSNPLLAIVFIIATIIFMLYMAHRVVHIVNEWFADRARELSAQASMLQAVSNRLEINYKELGKRAMSLRVYSNQMNNLVAKIDDLDATAVTQGEADDRSSAAADIDEAG